MDRETAKQEIRSRISCKDYLTKSKSGLYCCPFCGSGTGIHKTGALKVYDTNTFTCHSCNKSGDVIDLHREQTGEDYNTALFSLADKIGITIDSYKLSSTKNPVNLKQNFVEFHQRSYSESTREPENATQSPNSGTQVYTDYYQECRKRLNDPLAVAYLRQRGISLETAEAYQIGFDPHADTADSNHPCPRLIIPTSETHFIARRIDGIKDFPKLNPKGSTPAIFNNCALYTQDVREIFVTEGVFDALSVIEAGATAIALNSTSNVDDLLEQLEQQKTEATLILCLDADNAGRKAEEVLKQGLQQLDVDFITADICGGYKDPNEALIGNRDKFIKTIQQVRSNTSRPDNTQYYIDNLMRGEMERFKSDKKTGFNNLDAKAGGLYSGLYVLAAISSLGKTSFALQLADQLAASGNDVIFFSLEQSKLELISKSFARKLSQINPNIAATSLEIRKGRLSEEVLTSIADIYKQEIQDRISIVEGNFDCTISFIRDYIRQYIQRTNSRPVIFVDYLQILQPEKDERGRIQSVRETVDTTVTELKRISREFDLTIFVISSVNRANYLTPIDFESLKESGGIEFTADVIWGLQLQCLNNPEIDKQNNIKDLRDKIKKAKAADPRKIELVCLKNRYGISNYSCYFNYYPAKDLFTECKISELDFTPTIGTTPKAGRKLT